MRSWFRLRRFVVRAGSLRQLITPKAIRVLLAYVPFHSLSEAKDVVDESTVLRHLSEHARAGVAKGTRNPRAKADETQDLGCLGKVVSEGCLIMHTTLFKFIIQDFVYSIIMIAGVDLIKE